MTRTVFRRTAAPLLCVALVLGCSPAPAIPSATPSPTPLATSSPDPTAPPTAVASASPSAVPSVAPVVGAREPWIVLQQFPGISTVFLVRPDGTDLHSPTDDVPGGAQTNPDWSPDGSRLVMAVESGGREDLWVVDADGTDAEILVDCEGDCVYLDDPAWSPRGDVVLYSRVAQDGDSFAATLETVDVASGAIEVLVTAPPAYFYAGQRWSPDANEVVLEVVELTGPLMGAELEAVSLAVIDLASPEPLGRELLGADRFPETAAWAPDGSVIVFAAFEEPGADAKDLYTIRPDGSGLRQITTLVGAGGHATHPEVSADSASVVFSGSVPGEPVDVLAMVPIDGGEHRSATDGGYIAGAHPRLRPVP